MSSKKIHIVTPPPTGLEAVAIKATTWVGSVPSLFVHTVLFTSSFATVTFGLVSMDRMLLVLTTLLSFEAIYLAIFIQMSVNRQAQTIEGISEDVDDLTDDVEELSGDVEELSDDVEEVAKDVDEIGKDVDEIGKDVDEIAKDVDELSDDVEEIGKDIDGISDDIEDIQEHDEKHEKASFDKIESMLKQALNDLEKMRK